MSKPLEFDGFLQEIDGMIEATEEFIGDDELTPHNDPEGRFTDLLALIHVRNLYVDAFKYNPSAAEESPTC